MLFRSSLLCLSGLLHVKSSGAGFNGQLNVSAILVFPFSLEFFMGLFGTTDPRAVHSAWVLVIFGCGHTFLGESLTALVEVKFNSLTLAALSFNTAKDLLVFSISPLSRSREIEFSLNIAYCCAPPKSYWRFRQKRNYDVAAFATIIANFICFITLTREMLRLQFLSNYLSNFFSS